MKKYSYSAVYRGQQVFKDICAKNEMIRELKHTKNIIRVLGS